MQKAGRKLIVLEGWSVVSSVNYRAEMIKKKGL